MPTGLLDAEQFEKRISSGKLHPQIRPESIITKWLIDLTPAGLQMFTCRRNSILTFGLLLALLVRVASAGDLKASLKIGASAPSLKIEHWISDGKGSLPHINRFEPGKVYVVEFWATWCGPCIGAMPHLAELQIRLVDRGVQIISVSDEDVPTIEEFLNKSVPVAEGEEEKTYRELTSGYCLTTDPDKSVFRDYMEASGRRGIPSAFLIGKSGLVEWIGHPKGGLAEALEQVLNDHWDRDKFAREYESFQKWGVFESQLASLLKDKKFDEARRLWSREKPQFQKLFEGHAVMAERLTGYDSEVEENILLAPGRNLFVARKWTECVLALEEILKKATTARQIALANNMGFGALMNLKRYVDAGQVIDEMAASPPTDLLHGNVLNGMCWEVYEASIKPNGDIPRELIEASIRGSKKSCELDPEANDKLDTLAHLIGVTGDLNRAIELETQAFERETNPTEKSIYRKSLEKMRAKQRQ